MTNGSRVDAGAAHARTRSTQSDERDLATLSVAARQIRSMTRTSGTGTVWVTERIRHAGARCAGRTSTCTSTSTTRTMVTILEEARIPFLREPFGDDIDDHRAADRRGAGLYKGQLRLMDSPLQVTMWVEAGARGRLHARLRGALGATPMPTPSRP